MTKCYTELNNFKANILLLKFVQESQKSANKNIMNYIFKYQIRKNWTRPMREGGTDSFLYKND